ncbi:ArsR family transcriptional regulator [Candidatus Woesearchaeota archaeon]|nr:ArsR family transcriptional regulator [Candidatus Woesearchaeota archaeon]
MSEEFFDQKEKKALKLTVRRDVYLLVKKFAGCHFRELERLSKLPTGIIKYHLNYLAKHGLINEIKNNNNLRYFPKQFSSENKKLMGLLRQESIRRILLCLLVNDKCIHEQLTAFVKLSPSTVSWHLKKLRENNVVEFMIIGEKTHYHLLADKKEIVNLLITYRESFFDAMVERVIEMWEIE